MEQRRKSSYQLIALGAVCSFVAFGVIGTVAGLSNDTGAQQPVIKVIAALIGFSSGFLLIEVETERIYQRLNEVIAGRERELGRPLSPNELAEVKEMVRTGTDHVKGPRFNDPRTRILVRVAIVALPIVFLLTLLVTAGTFLIGIGVSMLLRLLTNRLPFQ